MKTHKRKTKKGASKGAGRLYKRIAGRDYPPTAPLKGNFYLTITRDGKRKTIALMNDDGNAITDRKQAEAEQLRLTAPERIKNEVQRARAVASMITHAEERLQQAIEESSEYLTISQAWPAYLEKLKYAGRTLGDRTEYTYERNWIEFEKWVAEHYPEVLCLRDVTTEHAEAFAAHICDKGETGKTFNNKIGFLKSFFKALRKCKAACLRGNPFDDVDLHKKQTKSKRALTVDELRRLIEAAEGEYKTLFIIGTFTGLRLYDCATLKWNEIDMERGLVVRVPHKTAKTGKAVRVGMPAYMREHLEGLPGKRTGYVVPEIAELYTEGRPMTVSRGIAAVFTKAGIERSEYKAGRVRAGSSEGFHALRHSYVSLMAERGAPMATVQALVGHSNPAMTQHYHTVTDAAALSAAGLLSLDGSVPAPREPLPTWARELVKTLTPDNAAEVRAELLA